MSSRFNHFNDVQFLLSPAILEAVNGGEDMYYFSSLMISMIVASFGTCSDTEAFDVEEMELTGVFDRIEDGERAVILMEELNKERVVPIYTLPPGSKVNIWFDVIAHGEKLEVMRINHGATQEALKKIREGQRKLRESAPAPGNKLNR
jgi:hypothetical protein